MTEIEKIEGVCSGRGCDFGLFSGSLNCVDGGRGCGDAWLMNADESDFHDKTLIKATAAVNAVLAMVPEDPDGRKLSFVHTRMGTLLAWSKHGGTVPEDAIGPDHPDRVVAEALGLKDITFDDPPEGEPYS